MVYCGKPSKACAECRLRRTKCDTLKPSCSQCRRAGRVCTGYRDPSDLRFRDESQGLRNKRQRQTDSAKTDSITTKAASSTNVGPIAISHATKAVTKSSFQLLNPVQTSAGTPFSYELMTPGEDQATCFFFRNYVLGDYKYGNGDFQYLPEIYANEEVGTALSQSIVSLGMVGLAHFWGASNILSQGQARYNSTLRLVSSLLRNIEDAKADQTLIAVMLLGLYEVNTCNSRQSMESWTKHVCGAAALLNLRGKQQLGTSIGHQLFVNLRGQVITNCIQRHAPIPTNMREWSKAALEFETPEQAALTSLSELSIKYLDIRSSMSSFKDYRNSENIIPALLALDAEYTEWASRCPPQFIYTTVNLKERSDEVFSDHYHIYPSIWVAKIWNGYRCVRILVNELLVDQLNHLFQRPKTSLPVQDGNTCAYENQILASNSMLLQLAHDICASVPYCLGYDNVLDPALREPPRAASGNLLLWPLYSAAVTGMVSPMMRDWVVGRLMLIGEVIGIKQAIALARSLMSTQDIGDWQLEDSKPEIEAPFVGQVSRLSEIGQAVS